MKRHTNDTGSTESIFTLVACFLLGGLMFIAIGFGVDRLTQVINMTTFALTAASQARYDTFNMQLMVFQFTPFLLLTGLIFYRVASSNREVSEVSSLSFLGQGTVELVVAQIVVMAATLFGGYGLDTLISIVTRTQMGAANTDGYSFIQYLPAGVYGFLFLASCGIVINYLLQCMQINVFAWLRSVF